MNDEEDKVLGSETSTEDESEVDNSEETKEESTEQKTKSRTAESRIDELTGEKKNLEEQLEKAKADSKTPMPPTDGKVSPEVQRAVDQLKSLGFVSKDDLDDRLRATEDRSTLNSLHTGLESRYDGSDGRPKYDRKEIELFMKDKGIWEPQIAYDSLNKDELLDFELKKAEENKKQKPYVEKQGQTQVDREGDAITREKINEWMKTPEGKAKYEKNRKKILTLMQQGEL